MCLSKLLRKVSDSNCSQLSLELEAVTNYGAFRIVLIQYCIMECSLMLRNKKDQRSDKRYGRGDGLSSGNR
jgi:hypothetical protein